jgi:hypothetical protein
MNQGPRLKAQTRRSLDSRQDTRPKLIGTRSFGFIWNVVLDNRQDDASAPRFDAEGPVPVVLLNRD